MAGFGEALFDALCQLLSSQMFVRYAFVSSRFGLADHGAPERLVTEKGNDHCWLRALEADSASSGSSMMHHCFASWEEPVVWRVLEHEHIVWTISIGSETTPTLRDQSANTGHLDSFKNQAFSGAAIGLPIGAHALVEQHAQPSEHGAAAPVDAHPDPICPNTDRGGQSRCGAHAPRRAVRRCHVVSGDRARVPTTGSVGH